MKMELEKPAMQMILHAGNARTMITKALDVLADGDELTYQEEIANAKEEIRQAHLAQTQVIQEETRGSNIQPTLLFIHAQDTLMTIISELNLAQSMAKLYNACKKG